jgi:hypothetical protein
MKTNPQADLSVDTTRRLLVFLDILSGKIQKGLQQQLIMGMDTNQVPVLFSREEVVEFSMMAKQIIRRCDGQEELTLEQEEEFLSHFPKTQEFLQGRAKGKSDPGTPHTEAREGQGAEAERGSP